MESRLHGPPISSTAQMTPKAAPFHSLTSGIRAPLTIDESDFEYSAPFRRNSISSINYSGSELDSDGFVSGEDELETASERLYVQHDPDEEIVKETHFVDEYSFSKPFVKNPNGDVVLESSNYNSYVLPRPYLKNLGREIAQESGNVFVNVISGPYVNEYDDSGSFASGSSEESVRDCDSVEKYDDSRTLVAVGNKVLLKNRPFVRIPQITGDSDDDSQGSEVFEDDAFLGVARVPSIELLQRINCAPKVRISDPDDDSDDNKSEADNMVFFESFVVNCGASELKGEKEQIGIDQTIDGAGIGQDEGPDVNKELRDNSDSELKFNQDLMHVDHEIQGVDVVDNGKPCLNLVLHREPTCMNEVTTLPGQVSSVALAAELGCSFESVGLIVHQVAELDSSGVCIAPSPDDADPEIRDKLESITEQKIEKKVEFSSSITTSKMELFSEYPEALMNTEQVDMYNGLLETDSLTGVSNVGRSVFLGSELDQEIDNEAESNNQLLSEAGNMSMVSEIEGEEASLSVSDGDNLEDISQETNCQQIIDSSISDGNADKSTSIDGIKKISLEKDNSDLDSISVTELKNPDICSSLICNGELQEAPSEGEKQIRGKYLWLLHRLGCYPEDSTEKAAMELLQVQTRDDPKNILRILVIGKSGVGKSATINSILGERKMEVDAFEAKTTNVKETVANVNGFELNIFDTPGLRTSLLDHSINRRVLLSIRKLIKKSPPDVVLYVDRLDTHSNDLPLLRSVTAYLGSSIWRKSVLVLTHSNSVPPDELFIAQRLQFLQKLISHSAGVTLNLLIPISLVENNYPLAAKHDGSWRSQLLLLSNMVKVLSEVNAVVKTQNVVCECDLQSQFCVGTSLKVNLRAGLNDKISGCISVKTSGCDQLQIALLALLPIAKAIFNNVFPAG